MNKQKHKICGPYYIGNQKVQKIWMVSQTGKKADEQLVQVYQNEYKRQREIHVKQLQELECIKSQQR